MIYTNAGNPLAVALTPVDAGAVLDVGCGAGDNSRLLKQRNPALRIVGVTHSAAEAELAHAACDQVHVGDITNLDPTTLGGPFDTLLFSHVLEHVADPVNVLRRLLPTLKTKGSIVILVPNVLQWRVRLEFLRGRFEYADHGVLDRTHLRFYTPRTIVRELIAPIRDLHLVQTQLIGSFPLGPLRYGLLPKSLRAGIDRAATQT
jgi:2-polyprenyl-3-methyl-5-hydroxy-6-metoxy-1,4-benzoquinol methylase